ncbi:MAG: hypothetical protein DRI94_05735 [Bacteroidetes bacterium]|nr:MAG: hypothetical protein DRI94_05735 [Bacteroidota bacterium]
MKKKTILIILLLIALLSIFFVLNKHKKTEKTEILKKPEVLIEKKKEIQKETKSEKQEQTKPETQTKQKKELKTKDENNYTWDELKIQPKYMPEGVYYTFTAFDVAGKTTVLAGNFDNKYIIRFFEDNKISDVEIKDMPQDILYEKGNLYVLCYKHLYILKNKRIIKDISFNIPYISLFDKLLFFDGIFNVLMSDGSAFQLIDDKLVRKKYLMTKDNTAVWVKKTSAKSFEIRTNPDNKNIDRAKTYKNEIGSITLIGNSSDDYYCIIDIIENNTTGNIKRVISSYKDNFETEKQILPKRTYSDIKNDIKIHNNILYFVIVNKNGLTLKFKKL